MIHVSNLSTDGRYNLNMEIQISRVHDEYYLEQYRCIDRDYPDDANLYEAAKALLDRYIDSLYGY